jgi:hypothetical protein
MRYLEGKFFLRSEADTYRTGQVIKASKREALVQYDQMVANPDPSWAMPMELVCHDELAHAETELGKVWGFFNSREELAAYLHWMNTPQQPGQQVVRLVPKRPVP